MKLIDIGLSYISEDSATAKAIKMAIKCYTDGIDFYEVRKRIHNTASGTFGIQGCKLSEIDPSQKELEIGAPGFDAPENVAFTIAGWLSLKLL